MTSKNNALSLLARNLDATGDVTADAIASTVSFGVDVYDSIGLLPYVGNTSGNQAFVNSTNRLYIWQGSGWYSIALINRAPTIASVLDSDNNSGPFALATDGTATTITITAADSDGDPITYSATADSDFAGLATISQDSSVFTITPFSTDSATTESGTITFKVTDGVNIASSGVQTFTLSFRTALWDETVLSIGTSSTNSLDNSTFIDRSTNAYTVTPIGTPIQTAFHPYLDNWSVEFDGSGDYLTLGSAVSFGTGDFTLEGWVYFKDNTTDMAIFGGNGTGTMDFRRSTDGSLRLGRISVAWHTYTGALSLANAWHHIAVVRSSGTCSIYVDGVSQSVTGASNTQSYNTLTYIARNSSGYYANAYFSNMRISDISRYSTNFTPSAESLSSDSDTLYLLCQSNRFVDNSTNNHAITPAGNPEVSAYNPFGQESEYAPGENKGSTYFDETSSEYLIADLNTLDNIDTTWTVECWAYPTTDGSPEYIIGFNGKDSANDYIVGVTASYLNAVSKGTQDAYILDGQWNHVAITCDGTTITLWINGVSRATQSYTGANPLSNCVAAVGCEFDAANGGAPGNYFNGYISDWGVSDTCKYTAEFTPPTSPVSADADVLYVPMDNAGIFDKTGNHILTLAGNTSTSTTQTKFADTAVYFDGTGDYAQIAQSPIFNFGTSDFTIEMWIYTGNVSSKQDILDKRSAANQSAWFLSMNLLASRVEFLSASTGWAGALRSDTGLPSNQWVHIAVTRDGSTFRLFQDGSQVATNTSANSIDDQDTPLIIGSGPDTNYFNGYIENLQILKGVAKYTANFTPPTQTQGRTYQAES